MSKKSTRPYCGDSFFAYQESARNMEQHPSQEFNHNAPNCGQTETYGSAQYCSRTTTIRSRYMGISPLSKIKNQNHHSSGQIK